MSRRSASTWSLAAALLAVAGLFSCSDTGKVPFVVGDVGGAGGTRNQIATGGSSGTSVGQGGSGGTSASTCETSYSYRSPECDDCMRDECCGLMRACDNGGNCVAIDECFFANCDGTSDEYSCLQSYCSQYASISSYFETRTCMQDGCSADCGISGSGGSGGSGGSFGAGGSFGSGGAGYCGDGSCDVSSGESCGSCSEDCCFSCETSWVYTSAECDSCMRQSCCGWVESCDSGTTCRQVDDCRFDYCRSTYDVESCVYENCNAWGDFAYQTWSSYFSCMQSSCSEPCAG